jgi:serine/threonine-protein kinase
MSDPIDHLNTALEGRYVIERELGEGGMATVYLADDLRHERKVALKVLKPELAAVVGADRFLTEIKTTAGLQHPHILPLHDSGEADGFLFYVMPYVEGETLAERIEREKQLPVDEAVRIATAVAYALQTAHEAGVVHRDIKPANILMSRGEPLVADFGIAIAVGAAGGSRMTETGLSVGTPYYMSPEQATGDQVVGPASDTYALACVLYEMLVGEPPYIGNTAQAVLGKIIQGTPVSATAARKSIPPNVDAAIRKALEKLPADRFTQAHEFARALADSGFRYGDVEGTAAVAAGRSSLLQYSGWGAAAVLAVALGWLATRPAPMAQVARFGMPFAEGQEMSFIGAGGFRMSPDGSSVAYRHIVENRQILMLRRWDELQASEIRETVGATQPSLSPDGQQIAFNQQGDIKVLTLAGGPVRTLGPGAFPTWGSDDYVYAIGDSGAIRMPATGGPAEVLTTLGEGEQFHWVSDVLPGTRYALTMVGLADGAEIRSLDLQSGEEKSLTFGGNAQYSTTGHLLYLADGTLMGAPFDVRSLEFTGSAVALVESVTAYSLSRNGKLLYTTGQGGAVTQRQLVWVDRSGNATVVDGSWMFQRGDPQFGLSISPDGARVALREQTDDGYDIWVKQLDQGPRSRLTLDGSYDKMPVWSPDGGSVTFLSDRAGDFDVWTKRADGTGSAELIFDMDATLAQVYWHPDGEWLILRTSGVGGVEGGRDIYGVRPGIDTVVTPFMAAEHDEMDPDFSPDGRFIVYTSNETDRYEVYVRPFPDVESGRWQISVNGGFAPLWSNSGQEIFFVDSSDQLVVVEVDTSNGLLTSPPTPLFRLPEEFETFDISVAYDLSPDDQRFMFVRIGADAANDASDAAVVLVTSFHEELRTRVPN